MRVKVEGSPPREPTLMVANHLSYLDIPLLGGLLPTTFVGKADLRGWPALGAVFDAAGTIFIDRGSKKDLLRVMDEVRTALADGLSVIVFPEGTSGRGDEILPFKPSLLEVAAASGLPVAWATIHYATPPGEQPPSESVCWWGDELLLPHYLRMIRLPSIAATVRFGAESVRGEDRKEIARALYVAMSAGFEPSL
ncbi:MAG: lysophospholipid acyltransferase family protein [Acidobacteriota bacterium]